MYLYYKFVYTEYNLYKKIHIFLVSIKSTFISRYSCQTSLVTFIRCTLNCVKIFNFAAKLITLANGKQLVMINGFTFHRNGQKLSSGGVRWICSSYHKGCHAAIVLDEDTGTIIKLTGIHTQHARPKYILCGDIYHRI